ncbi:chaperone protein dnaJ 49-like [Apium graveolens]|uniref:chaperone protein dnaJ 49-like n=1 Tax=Apium graveolens TaxID=4045 RepID=UPI003D7A9AA2
MDGNKDEAIKCLQIGRDALDIGDRSRALKFISKARRLDPSLQIDDLLSKIQSLDSPIDNESSKPKFTEIDANSTPRRRNLGTGSSSSSSSSGSVAYNEEQVSIVREIRRKKEFYDILGLERSASVEDIRKAYRKLSLKVHPDKNKAPGAEEAFKLVSKAFMCLNDEESRKRYDVVGSDEVVYERRPDRRNRGFNGFHDDGEFDADEIFRNFFFGGMNPGAATQFRGFGFGNGVNVRMGNNNGSAGGSNARTLIQLLPVILFVLLSLWPSPEPVYSLGRSYPYQHLVTTPKGVDYYVKSRNFEQEYPIGSNERAELEWRVEREYLSIVTQNCQIERQRLQWGFIKEAPHCNALKQFQAAAA